MNDEANSATSFQQKTISLRKKMLEGRGAKTEVKWEHAETRF